MEDGALQGEGVVRGELRVRRHQGAALFRLLSTVLRLARDGGKKIISEDDLFPP